MALLGSGIGQCIALLGIEQTRQYVELGLQHAAMTALDVVQREGQA